MATIKPFRGVLYNKTKIDEVGKVVCPPYDVISKEEQENYYELSPYNIIRVELGKIFPDDNENNNVYVRARNYLETWFNEEILIYDELPHYYLYVQEYNYEGKNYFRPGIVAAVQIEDYEAKVILPHEKTLKKAKEDRYRLLKETQTNVSQIFGFFSDQTRKARLVINEVIETNEPVYDFIDKDGVKHILYRIPEEFETDVFEALYDSQIFIADGHHRYETALRYRNEMRSVYGNIEDAWYEYVMMTLVPLESNMLVLPIHRLVNLESALNERNLVDKLKAFLEVTPVPGSEHLKTAIEGSSDAGVFGLITHANSFVLKVKPEALNILPDNIDEEIKNLDTFILSHLILKNIFGFGEADIESRVKFTSSFREIVETPKKDQSQIGFFLRPVSIEKIQKISLKGLTMPQKTSYFYPKLWTGLVMRSHLKT